MQTMSKDQAQLMKALLVLANGDSDLVEQAFQRVTPRPGTDAPALLDIVYFILRKTDREELIDQMRRELEGSKGEVAGV